jgi:hypothetical protein
LVSSLLGENSIALRILLYRLGVAKSIRAALAYFTAISPYIIVRVLVTIYIRGHENNLQKVLKKQGMGGKWAIWKVQIACQYMQSKNY